jgi:hypothetical protein
VHEQHVGARFPVGFGARQGFVHIADAQGIGVESTNLKRPMFPSGRQPTS